ncbi:uncharacterized protein YlaI [Alkalibacillus flavidus]|uniref:Uncharacterized protein YlaI n=1 Tax=Alkalibacillus flavidus TaxID=546021 RepID=A0ABV2KTT8_9BACI
MRAQCVICDQVDRIDSHSLLAKQMRKKRKMSYLCDECNERITDKTNKRKQSNDFTFYKTDEFDDYI